MSKAPKRPRDANQLAKLITDIATGEAAEADRDVGKDPAAVERGRIGGLKGGPARAAAIPSDLRRLAAQKAARARWANRD